MTRISVIIPVYNSEAYLGRCLDSLKAQGFNDWEAICVDDGSTDGSAAMLDEYSEGDKRIKVVHKRNEGVSEARNTALKACSGEYILFVDSDDFLHPQTMEICLHFAEKHGSDLVAFTYSRSYRTRLMARHILNIPEPKTTTFPKFDISEIESLRTEDIYAWATEYSHGNALDTESREEHDKRWIVKHCQPWRCLYRAEAVRDIKFIKGIIYEDFPWWGEVLLNTRCASIINLPLYYYYPNKTSYILSSNQEYRIQSLKIAIAAAKELYAGVSDEYRRTMWENNFIKPFEEKLAKKLKKA